ncbi:MAG: DUF6249 domain-containing protein [Dysgonamonadaceae bacterium]|jgi:fucose 4-O-acetylase-like acetyltransferase|nr:DUF6249 domain-containing protein [Dysgonamonadaceae bacterium]
MSTIDFNNLLPAILTLTMPFLFVIAITWIKSNEKQKQQQLKADLYAKAIENGQSVPSDWLVEPQKDKKNNALNTGILCMAIGIGLALFFWIMSIVFTQMGATVSAVFKGVASTGIIPFLIGIAFVIIHFIEKKKAANKDAQ